MSDKNQILLVDDDPNLVVTLGDFLSFEGYDVITANCAEQGLKRLEEHTPDLVILDMSMPGIGGIGFLNEVCDEAGKPSHPVLVLTARANMAEFFEDMQVDGFIAKPCDPNDLLLEISRIIYLRSGEKDSASAGAGSKIKMLLAEDELSLNRRMVADLSKDGFIVDSVEKGPEVLERAVLSRPDIIVLKHVLSGMDGHLVASILKDMPNVSQIPIVIYGCGGDTPTGDMVKAVVTTNDLSRITAAVRDVLATSV